MILSFACKETEKVSKREFTKKWNIEVIRVAMRRLLSAAISLEDLRIPPSNRLHALKGILAGNDSISVNMQWRIIFMWRDGHAYDVKMIDYH